MNEKKFLSFERWGHLLSWVKANNEGGKNWKPQWTYYLSPALHRGGEPVKVDCRVVWRPVPYDRVDERIHVSPSLLSNTKFEPFDANVAHLAYFKRGEDTSLPDLPSPESGTKPFDLNKLEEPDDGPVCLCTQCTAHYRALPFQSQTVCKFCQPPEEHCSHLVTNFHRCLKCRKITGDDRRLGLTPIVR